ncbi:MAG TPA: hypothetical protein V6D26_11425, partial [Stenomitos sp.]
AAPFNSNAVSVNNFFSESVNTIVTVGYTQKPSYYSNYYKTGGEGATDGSPFTPLVNDYHS